MQELKEKIFSFKRKKDVKLLLCLITVIVTAVIIFVSINSLVLLEESMKQDLRQTTVGNADLVLQHKNNELFEMTEVNNANMLAIMALKGKVLSEEENAWCTIWGVGYEKFLEVFGSSFNKKGNVTYPDILEKEQILVSPKIYNKLNLSNDNKVYLEFYGLTLEFDAVCAPEDNYFAKSNDELVIVEKSIFDDLLENEKYNISLAYLYNVNDIPSLQKQLVKQYPYLDIKEAIDPEYISENMMTYYGVEILIFVFILFVARDILNSTGKIFVMERSRQIGTLRSIGMTKVKLKTLYKKLATSLALKGTTIAIVFGIIGILLASKEVVGLMDPLDAFDIRYFIVALIFTFIIVFVMSSSSFKRPLNKLLEKTDRALLIEDVSAEIKFEKGKKYDILFIPLLILLIIVLNVEAGSNAYFTMFLTCLMYVCLYKTIKYLFAIVVKKVKKYVKQGTSTIAVKNVVGNFYLRKTLDLTMIISLFIIIIGVLIFSILDAMTSFYKDYKVDAFIRTESGALTDKEIAQVKSIDGISYIYQYYSGNVTIKTELGERKVSVLGFDNPIDFDHECVNLHLEWLEGFDIVEFNSGHYTIVSEIMMNRFELELGDVVVLDDGMLEREYKIVATTSSLQELGDLIYISRFDKNFANGTIINGLYVKSDDVRVLEEEVNDIFYEKGCHFKDVTEMRENDLTNGMQIILFFVMFAMLVTLTSITGIYSNYKLSYIMRKKEFAILGSVGYNKKHILSILLKEVIIISFLSYFVGVVVLILIKKPLEIILSYIELPIEIQINPIIFLALLIVVILMMFINIALAVKSCKLINKSLIEEIKR